MGNIRPACRCHHAKRLTLTSEPSMEEIRDDLVKHAHHSPHLSASPITATHACNIGRRAQIIDRSCTTHQLRWRRNCTLYIMQVSEKAPCTAGLQQVCDRIHGPAGMIGGRAPATDRIEFLDNGTKEVQAASIRLFCTGQLQHALVNQVAVVCARNVRAWTAYTDRTRYVRC